MNIAMPIAGSALPISLYLYGVALYRERFPERAFPQWRLAAFFTGVLVMTAVLLPPIDPLAETSFAWHMTQHVALMLIGPPLLLLGAPLLLLVAVPPAKIARRLTGAASSPVGSALFAP